MKLPPLNALRAFEAAARLGSFAAAASELNVSAGAVSRHIKLLEANLGVGLFIRLPQGVHITDAGLHLAKDLSSAFEAISEAAQACQQLPTKLRLIASPTFANRRLIPRLRDFTSAHPEIDVSVGVFLCDLNEITSRDYDCGVVTIGDSEWPVGWVAVKVSSEELVPVCSPSVLEGRASPHHPTILHELPLLPLANCPQDWPLWIEANAVDAKLALMSETALETGEMAIRAAVEGLGVIIMDRYLIEPELQNGTLVELFPNAVPVENGYYFICDEKHNDEHAVAAFRDWVVSTFGI